MIHVVLILILVAFSALFSSTETAFACVNKIRLKHMADSGDKRAGKALDIANRYEDASRRFWWETMLSTSVPLLWQQFFSPSTSALPALPSPRLS